MRGLQAVAVCAIPSTSVHIMETRFPTTSNVSSQARVMARHISSANSPFHIEMFVYIRLSRSSWKVGTVTLRVTYPRSCQSSMGSCCQRRSIAGFSVRYTRKVLSAMGTSHEQAQGARAGTSRRIYDVIARDNLCTNSSHYYSTAGPSGRRLSIKQIL
jgi:hypothetical protein